MFETHETDWDVGDRILAPWESEWLYPGVVLCIDEDVAFIKFDDGDRAIVPLEDLRAIQMSRGDTIYCRRDRALRRYYPAEILSVRDEELHVQYEDGAEDFTTISFIRVPMDDAWTDAVADEN